MIIFTLGVLCLFFWVWLLAYGIGQLVAIICYTIGGFVIVYRRAGIPGLLALTACCFLVYCFVAGALSNHVST